jgi:hypothetical protein
MEDQIVVFLEVLEEDLYLEQLLLEQEMLEVIVL